MLPDAVFLDFDGLVCDTERAAQRSWRDLYARNGFELPGEVWQRMVGRSVGERVAAADLGERRGSPLTNAELVWRRNRKQELADAEPLRPGVDELIAQANRHGVPVAVVSSSGSAWVGPHLYRLGVRARLSFMVTGDDTPRHKPAPDLYLLALRRAGAAAASTVAFEDSPSGVAAALDAGLCCVGVPSAIGSYADLAAADQVLDGLDRFPLDNAILHPKDAILR